MKKTKEVKEEKTKNEPEMKIYEYTKSIANTNRWVSQLKRIFFFLESRWRGWVFFFLLSFFCLFLLVYSFFFFFCLLLSFLLHFVTCILRKSVSLFLSLSTFQVINMGFLNEMWYKGLIQRILGCGDFFFLRKLKIWWFDWISCHFSLFCFMRNC